jgi:hypothetical protein
MIGIYSEEATKFVRTVWYKDSKGQLFEVTCVGDPSTFNNYGFFDKVVVSTDLVEYVKDGRPPSNPINEIVKGKEEFSHYCNNFKHY